MTKLEDLYYCPTCNIPFHYQSPRSKWIKLFMPNAPIRRFFCGKCVRKYYISVDPEDLKKKM